MLERAIYVSDAKGAVGSTVLSIAQILGASHVNNRRDHLTGALMFHAGQFLQIIEGARVDLDRLLTRLRADPRHENLALLFNGPVCERHHGEDPMVRLELDETGLSILNGRPLRALAASEAEHLMRRTALARAA